MEILPLKQHTILADAFKSFVFIHGRVGLFHLYIALLQLCSGSSALFSISQPFSRSQSQFLSLSRICLSSFFSLLTPPSLSASIPASIFFFPALSFSLSLSPLVFFFNDAMLPIVVRSPFLSKSIK